MKLPDWFERFDARFVAFMSAYGPRAVRISLGIVFVWFGLLKVIGRSPVAELVAHTVYWLPARVAVPLLGGWEMAVGLGLLFRMVMRLTLLLFWMLLAGTFLVLVLRPEIAFQGGNPMMLTMEGEFVIKNLALIAGGLVVGGRVREVK